MQSKNDPTSISHQLPNEVAHLSSFASVVFGLKNQESNAQIEVYQRYVYQLVNLASSRIAKYFNGKVDAEDIVQSVFNSFFGRYQVGKVNPQNWNELWSLLATMTVRKCLREIKKFSAEKRTVHREVTMHRRTNGSTCGRELPDIQPSAYEQLVFEETFSKLIEPLTELQKQIIALKLSGYSKTEISKKVGRTERTVHRTFERIRQQMELLLEQEDEARIETP